MKLYNIKTYYLNSTKLAYKVRYDVMENMFFNYGFTNYERFAFDYNGHKSIGNILGHIELTKHAIEKNIFPFIILEDDAYPITSLEHDVEVPNNADLIYLGCSLYENSYNKGRLSIHEFDSNYYRLIKALTTHALIISTKYSAMKYIEIISRSIDKKIPIDASLCSESENSIFLTPKNGPYFYQKDCAHLTKFLWADLKGRYYNRRDKN